MHHHIPLRLRRESSEASTRVSKCTRSMEEGMRSRDRLPGLLFPRSSTASGQRYSLASVWSLALLLFPWTSIFLPYLPSDLSIQESYVSLYAEDRHLVYDTQGLPSSRCSPAHDDRERSPHFVPSAPTAREQRVLEGVRGGRMQEREQLRGTGGGRMMPLRLERRPLVRGCKSLAKAAEDHS